MLILCLFSTKALCDSTTVQNIGTVDKQEVKVI